MSEFDEYIRQGEPGRKEKAAAWQTAIGLQDVDGLKPSAYLIDAAKKHIEGDITIDAKYDGQLIKFVISDSGVAFDPTEAANADTTLSAEDRPIGGLGILLVRKLMDIINYERMDGKNVLTLKKTIKNQ